MNAEYIHKLLEFETDYNGALARFVGNEALYEKFLLKFLSDPNFPGLKACVDAKNYTDAFQYAHTLKGVSGNLGLNKIYYLVHPIVEKLRKGDSEGIEELMIPLEETYQSICDLIRTYS